jgi:predicted nicotinamide N-methyase
MGRLEPIPLPGCERISLGLINADFPVGPLPGQVMQEVLRNPPYWSLCWGSGLALARLLLDDPGWVADKAVVDLGSGSGVVAIAAALAGARSVVACDTDPDARLATSVNARLNAVELHIAETPPERCDILLMADVLYDKSNLPLLAAAHRLANEVLVADSRISELPDPSYKKIRTIDALTCPNLGEFDEFRTVHVFHHVTDSTAAPA